MMGIRYDVGTFLIDLFKTANLEELHPFYFPWCQPNRNCTDVTCRKRANSTNPHSTKIAKLCETNCFHNEMDAHTPFAITVTVVGDTSTAASQLLTST